MKIQLHGEHSGAVTLKLAPKERFSVLQAGLVAMSNYGDVAVQGIGRGVSQINNGNQENEFWLAGQLPGQPLVVELANETLLVQQDVLLGAQSGLQLKPASHGLHARCEWLQVGGSGKLLLAALGTIYPLQIDSEYLVNSAYVIAYSSSLRHQQLSRRPGADEQSFGTFKFTGRGYIWCQTHRPQMLGGLLSPHLQRFKNKEKPLA